MAKVVWSAWSEAELLDQWWAPKPWKTETASMDCKEGGRWLYAMVGPQGERHNAFMDYQAIAPKKVFTAREGFADLAQLETLIQMGFMEGYTMGLDNLEKLLARIQKEGK